jgi:hypothetical protein
MVMVSYHSAVGDVSGRGRCRHHTQLRTDRHMACNMRDKALGRGARTHTAVLNFYSKERKDASGLQDMQLITDQSDGLLLVILHCSASTKIRPPPTAWCNTRLP